MKNSSNTGLVVASVVCLAAALGATGTALYFRNRAANAEERLKAREAMAALVEAAPPVANVATTVSAPRDAGDLLPRVYELEAALAERDALIAAMMQEVAFPDENRQRNNGGGRQNFQGNMQNLAVTDPQRFAEIQAQRDAFRQRMEQALADRKNFFDRDPSTLTADMQGTYAAVRSLLDEAEELGRLMQSQDLSQDERREAGAARRELQERLDPLLQNVRRDEIMKLGADMGYSLVQQRQLVEYINLVYDVTSSAPRMGGGPGGGGGNRGGGRGQ